MDTQTLQELIQQCHAHKRRPKPNRDGFVFTAQNVHAPGCDRPPGIENDPTGKVFTSYYENDYGEQFVVLIDRDAKLGIALGGDFGWNSPILLKDGAVQGVPFLGELEFEWLALCWKTATKNVLRRAIDLRVAAREMPKQPAPNGRATGKPLASNQGTGPRLGT